MKAIATAIAALAAGATLPAAAQTHHSHATAAAVAQADAASLADAEVRRVDRDAGKITLKHGYIKSLDMPPMTMVFQVADKALLDKVKPGDKVKFAAVEKAGAYVVTSIDVAK